ncbi:hypothetical protein [Nocardia sp. NPDC024068]
MITEPTTATGGRTAVASTEMYATAHPEWRDRTEPGVFGTRQ